MISIVPSIFNTMPRAKAAIPKALKNAVWLKYIGKNFETKCNVTWCNTIITPFNFETGHNIPESKGGPTNVENLRPICAQCNKSMGARYSIDEFGSTYSNKANAVPWWKRLFACNKVVPVVTS